MVHPIYQVVSFEIVGPHVLRVCFDDGTQQRIDLRSVLAGEVYGPLRQLDLFNQARLDPEVHTIIWPNGADFDPATLHDWPFHARELAARAASWEVRDRRLRRSDALLISEPAQLRLHETGPKYEVSRDLATDSKSYVEQDE